MIMRSNNIVKAKSNRNKAIIFVCFVIATALSIILAYFLDVINPVYLIFILVTLLIIPVLLSAATWKLWLFWPILYALIPLALIFGKIPWKIYSIRTFLLPFVLLSIIIGLSLFWRRHKQAPMEDDQSRFELNKPSIAFLIVLLVSLIVAGEDLGTGLIYWASWAVYIVFIYHVLLNSFDNENEISTLLIAYVISVAAVAVYGIINFFFLHLPANIVIGKSGGTDITLINLNESAWIAMVTLPLSICCAFSGEFSSKFRLIFRISSFVLFIQLLLMNARWAWISLLAGFIIIILIPLKRGFSTKPRLLALILVFVLVGILFYSLIPAVSSPMKSLITTLGKIIPGGTSAIAPGEADYPRMALYKGSIEVIKGHWLLGTGVGNYWLYFPGYLSSEARVVATPHNFYLRIFAESGVAGLLTFLIFLFFVGKGLFTAIRNEEGEGWSWILYGFAISFITLIIYENGIESAFSPFFWFFMGLLGAAVRCRQQDRTT